MQTKDLEQLHAPSPRTKPDLASVSHSTPLVKPRSCVMQGYTTSGVRVSIAVFEEERVVRVIEGKEKARSFPVTAVSRTRQGGWFSDEVPRCDRA